MHLFHHLFHNLIQLHMNPHLFRRMRLSTCLEKLADRVECMPWFWMMFSKISRYSNLFKFCSDPRKINVLLSITMMLHQGAEILIVPSIEIFPLPSQLWIHVLHSFQQLIHEEADTIMSKENALLLSVLSLLQ